MKTLRVTCATPDLARRFSAFLTGEGVDTLGIEDADVLIPWGGDLPFMFAVFEAAVEQGCAHDGEAARQQSAHFPAGTS